jgi:epoxyqueuosine reductase
VAAYAVGDDYHDVLRERLEQLAGFIERHLGESILHRGYTDTGPILERDLAQRAGLGWIGKNTCLLHPGAGSYWLLAELFLGVDLEPDPPFTADHCGECRRCIEACPTGCILPDRTLDSRRCISYLTIELKGAIPSSLRPLLGKWVFGCDVCQQACPWNQRFARPQTTPIFAARAGLPFPDLIEVLSLSQEEFSRRFRGSPLKRARRAGFLRNVAVALGNWRDTSALTALASSLRHEPEALVRSHVAWAIGRIGGQEAAHILALAARNETDLTVLGEIHQALAALGSH